MKISHGGARRHGALSARKSLQRALSCTCGRQPVFALGLCASCYSLKRQNEAYFGGLREVVLQRDGYRCRVCDTPGRSRNSIAVHHRVPGKSLLNLMIALCPGCHAKIHRTIAVLSEMPPLLLKLWREQHPVGQEQRMLNFDVRKDAGANLPLLIDWEATD